MHVHWQMPFSNWFRLSCNPFSFWTAPENVQMLTKLITSQDVKPPSFCLYATCLCGQWRYLGPTILSTIPMPKWATVGCGQPSLIWHYLWPYFTDFIQLCAYGKSGRIVSKNVMLPDAGLLLKKYWQLSRRICHNFHDGSFHDSTIKSRNVELEQQNYSKQNDDSIPALNSTEKTCMNKID